MFASTSFAYLRNQLSNYDKRMIFCYVGYCCERSVASFYEPQNQGHVRLESRRNWLVLVITRSALPTSSTFLALVGYWPFSESQRLGVEVE